MKLILIILLSLSSYAFAGLRVGNIDIKGFEKYPDQLQLIEDSFEVIEEIINSEEFKERVTTYPGYTSTKLSPKEVYEALMLGKELSTVNDSPGEMNFSLKRWKFRWPYRRTVVAESDGRKSTEIRISEWFYSWYGTSDMAGNITHEWIHLLGFTHKNAEDSHSVPYAVGNIMRELAQKRLREEIELVLE